MGRTSRSAAWPPGLGRKLWFTTYLPASFAANIRGTSIAKTVISVEGDCDHRVGPRDAVERTS